MPQSPKSRVSKVHKTSPLERRVGRRRVAKRRPQGRPTEGADAVGPDALIAAAQELLETLPPAKVTRAAVARHAGVDPSLIRYYFSDRASLLLAVLNRVIGEGPPIRAESKHGTAAERLRDYVRNFFQFNAAHPFLHRLLIEEIAVSESSEARKTFHELNHVALGVLGQLIKDGVKDGSLRRLDPVLLHVAIIGMCEFFLSSRVLLEDALGKAASPQSLSKRYADVIAGLVLEGVRTR